MNFQQAERINRLGTETAFAVAARAQQFMASGGEVFPFHLGDMNLPTPEHIVQAAQKAIADGKTGYCPSAGIPELRHALAREINQSHGTHYEMENVAIQPGGKPVIAKFIQSVMNEGDEVLYPNPGYPIYESQIEYFGGVARPYSFLPGANGELYLDMERLEASITPKTKAVIVNDLHNPTGIEHSAGELEKLARLAVKHNLFVLADEAYFDIRYQGKSRSLASFPGMAERTVILYTFSKRFAMTGWRLGAAVGPKSLIEIISKLNVNNESCSCHFIQHAALAGLQQEPAASQQILEVLRRRRDLAVEMLSAVPGFFCPRPEATFYLFPEVSECMRRKGFEQYKDFAEDILVKTGVSVCTREHFGRVLPGEEKKYIRLAYSGIDIDRIEQGLTALIAYGK